MIAIVSAILLTPQFPFQRHPLLGGYIFPGHNIASGHTQALLSFHMAFSTYLIDKGKCLCAWAIKSCQQLMHLWLPSCISSVFDLTGSCRINTNQMQPDVPEHVTASPCYEHFLSFITRHSASQCLPSSCWLPICKHAHPYYCVLASSKFHCLTPDPCDFCSASQL